MNEQADTAAYAAESTVHLTVATVVEQDQGFLMVSEYEHGRLVINQPAGHWEQGETLLEAARRETLEETGWQVELDSLLGILLSTTEQGISYCRVAFAATAILHDPEQTLDPDIVSVDWFSAEELRSQRGKMRSSLVLRTLDMYLSGQRHPLSVVDSLPAAASQAAKPR